MQEPFSAFLRLFSASLVMKILKTARYYLQFS